MRPSFFLLPFLFLAGLALLFSPVLESASAAFGLSPAYAATVPVSATIMSGALTLATPVSAALPPTTLNLTSTQTASGSLGVSSVTDSRGSGAGWSVTATCSNFTHIGSPVTVSGTSQPIISGTYLALAFGTYTVTIVSGGGSGTATYSVSGLETQSSRPTSLSPQQFGMRGLNISFPAGTYAAGDQWTIDVDAISVNDLTITPSSLSASSGMLAGVSLGPTHTFAATSEPATVMSAAPNGGMGSYSSNLGLSLAIPTFARAGSYWATITETVN